MSAKAGRNALVGIAFNAYDPLTANKVERASEESVEQTAKEVLTAVTELGYATFIIPLQKSFMHFSQRLKALNADVLINLCEAFLGQAAAGSQRGRRPRTSRHPVHRERFADPGPVPQQVQNQGGPEVVRLADALGRARGCARPEDRFAVSADRQAEHGGRQSRHPSGFRRPRRGRPPQTTAAYPGCLRELRPGRDVHRRTGVQRLGDGRGKARGTAGQRDRVRRHARGPAEHLQLRGQVADRRRPVPVDAAAVPGPDRRLRSGPYFRRPRSRRLLPANAAITPGWIFGWTKKAGRSSWRSIPTPTSA